MQQAEGAFRRDSGELLVVDDQLVIELHSQAVAFHRDHEAVPLAGFQVGLGRGRVSGGETGDPA